MSGGDPRCPVGLRALWARPVATAVGALLLAVAVHLARGGALPHSGPALSALALWTGATTGLALVATRRFGSPVASAAILALGQVGMEVALTGPQHLSAEVIGPALVWHGASGAVLGVALVGLDVASDTVAALLERVLPPCTRPVVARPRRRSVPIFHRVPARPPHHASAWSLRGPPRLA